MQPLSHFDAADLKLIYRILHKGLMQNLELMDSDFFERLQGWLQTCARSEGVDVSNHSEWDAWLGNRVVACEDRVADRRILSIV
jgi:hypothetical protein